MHHLKSTSLVAILAVSTGMLHAGDFKAFDYETPAYVDLEFSEIRVNEPAGVVTVNIIRSGDFRQTTTIDYQTVAETASEGEDYKGAGGTIIFKPGEGFKTIQLEILQDEEVEEAESFLLELSSTDPKAMLMRKSLAVTINDAPAPISAPRLEIATAAGNIVLSWDGSDRCALERTLNPAGGVWEAVDCAPVVEENRCEVLQTLGGPFYFYRLRLP